MKDRAGKHSLRGWLESKDCQVIYGAHAVTALLAEGTREVRQLVVQTSESSQSRNKAIAAAQAKGVQVIEWPRARMDAAVNGASHQGVIAMADPLPTLDDKELLELVKSNVRVIIAVLDSIQDPHNMGAIIRTAEAAGLTAVVVQKTRSAPLDGAAAKAAAGSIERIPVCRTVNIRNLLVQLKQHECWIGALSSARGESPFSFKIPARFVIVIGSESHGIRRLIDEECDYHLRIPMTGHVQSLNASVAAGVAFYALAFQSSGR